MKFEKRTKSPKVIRKDDLIPGVIYGGGLEGEPIQVTYKEFTNLYAEYGTNRTFSINLDGKKHIVYIKDYQLSDYGKHKYLHFDLMKVSAKDTIESSVRLAFEGKEEVYKKKLILQVSLDSLDIEYVVGSGVSSIEIDVSEMEVDDTIYVKDVVAPEGVKILNNLEDLVARVTTSSVQDEPTVVEGEEGEEGEETTEEAAEETESTE